MNDEKCYWQGCECAGLISVYGSCYCREHLPEGLKKELYKCGSKLPLPDSEKARFMSLFGRYVDSLPGTHDLESLSLAKIRDRASLINYEQGRVVFEIERHGDFIPIIQTWVVNLTDNTISKDKENPLYFTVKQLAKELNLSVQQVRKRIKDRGVPATRADDLAATWSPFMRERGHDSIANNPLKLFKDGSTPPHTILVSKDDIDKLR